MTAKSNIVSVVSAPACAPACFASSGEGFADLTSRLVVSG